jgi:hypothetical protein
MRPAEEKYFAQRWNKLVGAELSFLPPIFQITICYNYVFWLASATLVRFDALKNRPVQSPARSAVCLKGTPWRVI